MTGKALSRINKLAATILDIPSADACYQTAHLQIRAGYATRELFEKLHTACEHSPSQLADDLTDARVSP